MTLKQKTFSAGRWTAASAFISSGLQVLQIAVLARLLQPADFGLMAVTASILAVLSLFADLGLSRAIIHFENIPESALTSLYWLNLLAGLALSVTFAIAAPLLGKVFHLDGLSTVLVAISPFFVLSSLGQQFCAVAEKEFRFSTLAVNEILAATCGLLVAVSIALLDGGVYALVGAALTTTSVSSALAWIRLSQGHRPSIHFDLAETRPYLNFGSYLVGESTLNTLLRQADVFVAGAFANPAALGLYSLPRDLSLRIGMIVNPIITRVGFPVMSRLQGDVPALKAVYLQTLRMTASVNFPIYVALGMFANEIVALLYGPRWNGAVTYLQVFAAWGLIRSTGNPVGSLLHAVGAVRRAFWWNVACVLLLPSLYWLATSIQGLYGLAMGMVLIQIFLVPFMWRFLVRPCCNASFSEYLGQLITPLILSLLAGLAAFMVTRNVPHGTLRLLLGGTCGGAIYLVLCRHFNSQWFSAMWTLLRLPQRAQNS